jgi:RNA polymerase-interacting CarD/CdnL/TRCF family regulator
MFTVEKLLSIAAIVALLREQASGRALENDERGILMEAADLIERDVAALELPTVRSAGHPEQVDC